MANEIVGELEQEAPNLTSFGSCAGSLVLATLDEAQKILKAHRGSAQQALTYALAELLERQEITDEDHGDLSAIYADIYAVSRSRQSLQDALRSVREACEKLQQRKTSSPVSRIIGDVGLENLQRIQETLDEESHDEEWVVMKASLGHQILAAAAVGAIVGSAWGGAGAVVGAFAGPIVGALIGACSGDDDD